MCDFKIEGATKIIQYELMAIIKFVMRLIEFWIYLPKHVPIIQFITVGAVQQMGALHGHCEFDVQPKIYNILHLTIIHVKYVFLITSLF